MSVTRAGPKATNTYESLDDPQSQGISRVGIVIQIGPYCVIYLRIGDKVVWGSGYAATLRRKGFFVSKIDVSLLMARNLVVMFLA